MPRTVVKDKEDPYANVGRNDPCRAAAARNTRSATAQLDRIAGPADNHAQELAALRERIEKMGSYLHIDDKRGQLAELS